MKKNILKIESSSQKWFGATILLLSIMLIFTSLGKTEWLMYISAGFSIVLGFVIYTEGGIRDYLKRKGYKQIDGNDLLVWTSFIFGTFLLLNAIIIIFGNVLTGGFANFIRSAGVVGGSVSGILAIFLLVTKRPKA